MNTHTHSGRGGRWGGGGGGVEGEGRPHLFISHWTVVSFKNFNEHRKHFCLITNNAQNMVVNYGHLSEWH